MLGDFDAMEGRIKTEQDRKCTYYVPLRRVRVIIFFRGKEISITLYVRVSISLP
jgi:hypothetical protein